LRNAVRETVTGGCYCCLLKEENVKLFLVSQYHVFTQSPSGMSNIQSTILTVPDLYKKFHLQYYLLTTVIYIQSLRSQMCVYTSKYCHHKLITDNVFNLSRLTHTICDARFWLWYRPMQAVGHILVRKPGLMFSSHTFSNSAALLKHNTVYIRHVKG
jgi:hypothetical protein